MFYIRHRLLSSGTYAPGTDWTAQFDGQPVSGAMTVGGEIQLSSLTAGQCASQMVFQPNPCVIDAWVEFNISTGAQVNLNGIVTNLSTPGLISLDFQAGFNVLHVVVPPSSPLVLRAILAGPAGGALMSLYPDGLDPLGGSAPGSSSHPSSSSTPNS